VYLEEPANALSPDLLGSSYLSVEQLFTLIDANIDSAASFQVRDFNPN
jgi:hypothetical protein